MTKQRAPALRLANDATPANGRSDWWNWSVWVEATPSVLKQIASVTYTLHPTFPNPVRKVSNLKHKFILRGSGWGEFDVHATIEMKDGAKREASRWLRFGRSGNAASKHHKPTAQTARAVKSVFIIHALPELLLARQIADALEHGSVKAISTEHDFVAGMPIRVWVEKAIQSCSAAVVLVGHEMPSGVLLEVGMAIGAGKEVIPILVGSVAPPPSLQSLNAIHLRDGIPGPEFVSKVTDRLKL